jgi:hypothetical protein
VIDVDSVDDARDPPVGEARPDVRFMNGCRQAQRPRCEKDGAGRVSAESDDEPRLQGMELAASLDDPRKRSCGPNQPTAGTGSGELSPCYSVIAAVMPGGEFSAEAPRPEEHDLRVGRASKIGLGYGERGIKVSRRNTDG